MHPLTEDICAAISQPLRDLTAPLVRQLSSAQASSIALLERLGELDNADCISNLRSSTKTARHDLQQLRECLDHVLDL